VRTQQVESEAGKPNNLEKTVSLRFHPQPPHPHTILLHPGNLPSPVYKAPERFRWHSPFFSEIFYPQLTRLRLGGLVLEVLTLVAHSAMQERAEAALLCRQISGEPPEAVGDR